MRRQLALHFESEDSGKPHFRIKTSDEVIIDERPHR